MLALVENLQRRDLDYIEEAEGLQKLMQQYHLSQEQAARRIGKSQSAVANKLRILRHPPSVLQALRENHLTERHAHAHQHEATEHGHRHVHDEHHQHEHPFEWDPAIPHSHLHTHSPIKHSHPHFPDIHHRHRH